MNCDKCESPLLDGELFCKKCGYEYAYHKQREKLHEAEEKKKNLIKNQCHSKLFLILTLCLTVTAITNLFSAFIGGIFSIFTTLLPAIFITVTAIGLWKCYFAKSDDALEKGLKSARSFDSYQKIILDIIIAIICIIYSIITLSIIGSCSTINSMTDSSDATGTSFFTCLIVLVIVAAIIGIITLYKKIFIQRIDFFNALKQSVSSGKQYPFYFSKGGSYAIGIIILLPAILGLIFSFLISQAINGIDSIVNEFLSNSEMGDFSEITGILESVLGGISDSADSLVISTLISNSGNICLGLYYILGANWMSSIEDEFAHANRNAEQARSILAEIERDTRRAVGIFKAEEKEKNSPKSNESIAQTKVDHKKESSEKNAAYSIVKDGKGSSPISIDKLREMAISGELLPETMVWKRGMPSWVRADSVDELSDSFPPPIDIPALSPVDMPPIPEAVETIDNAPNTNNPGDSAKVENNDEE